MRKRLFHVGPLCAISFLLAGLSASAQMVYIPTSDPVNELILELQARGYLDNLSQTERPWLVSDVIDDFLEDELSFDPQSLELALQVLAILEPPQRSDIEPFSTGVGFGLGFRGFSREDRQGYFYYRDDYISRGFKKEFGSTYKARLWLSRDDRWGTDSELIFDSDGVGYPWYYGTPHNARVVGQFDRAYFKIAVDRFDFLFGRHRLVWGPSPRGSLLLDDNSPPLDMFRYGFSLRPFTLSGFASRLDNYVDPVSGVDYRRFLSGHRLRINPGKGWEVALSEVFLYGGPDRIFELYYTLPTVLYYWEAQNRNLDDNAFWGLDISWTRGRLGRFYAQFVFDDIQRQHRAPQKFAMQFGTHLAPGFAPGWSGLFEINFVDTYVYGQRQRYNAYLYWDRPLSRLDSDQREYFAGIYKRLSPSIKLGTEFAGRDKGEYDAADFQPAPTPFGQKFPLGTVEWTRDISLVGSFHKFTNLNLDLSAGYQTVDNFQHAGGADFDQFYIMFDFSYGIDAGLPFWTRFQ